MKRKGIRILNKKGFVLWEVLFSMVLLAMVIGAFSEGYLNWKIMDRQASSLGDLVFVAQNAMEEFLQNGNEGIKINDETGIKVIKKAEQWGDLEKFTVRVGREDRGKTREIEFVTLRKKDCILRGGD